MNGLDMWWARPAAAANNVEKSCLSPFFKLHRHGFRGFVIFPKFIGKTCVGMCGYMGICNPCKFLNMLPQLLGTQSTVKAKGNRTGMFERVPEGGHRLS